MATTIEYNGNEYSTGELLDLWGLTGLTREQSNQFNDVVGFDIEDDADKDDLFAYGDEIIIHINRTKTDSGAWTGGSIHFIGYRVETTRTLSAEFERFDYRFVGPWGFLFDRLEYQQQFGGAGTGAPAVYRSQVVLGKGADGNTITVGAQITDIVNYLSTQCVADYGEARVQVGNIDVGTDIPIDAAQDIMCSEAIRKCVRWLGAGMTSVWVDYSTTPPSLHVKNVNDLPAVSRSIIGEPGLKITRRDDLIPSKVHLMYRRQITDTGVVYTDIAHDIASPVGYIDSNGIGQGGTWQVIDAGGKQFNALAQTFDFEGPVINRAKAAIKTNTFNATNLNWWKSKCPELQSITDLALSVNSNGQMLEITPVNDGESLLDLGRELVDGTWANWMSETGQYQEVQVTAHFSGTQKTTDGVTTSIWAARPCGTKVKLTNLASGTYYSRADVQDGEVVPFGLAKYLYDILKTPQYQGTLNVAEDEITGFISVGNVLNLTGGKIEWETMRAQVQSVTFNYDDGVTTVSFGPAVHLGAADLIELLRVNRPPRTAWLIGTNRTNTAESQSGLELGSVTPKENSTSGVPIVKYTGVVESNDKLVDGQGSKNWQAYMDAVNREMVMKASGWVDETNHGEPEMRFRLDYIENPTPVAATVAGAGDAWRNRHVGMRQMPVIADATGKLKQAYVFCTEPVEAGLGSISGGGGILTCYKILEIFPDYLRCRTWNGSGLGDTDVLVAKQLFARQSRTRQVVDGDATYGFTYVNDNKRTTYVVGSATENSQIALLHDPYQVGGSYGEDIIWAIQVTWSGVTVSGTPLTWMEVYPHRNWSRKQVQA